jgi:NAD(P)H-dependent FMN reductase
MNHILIVGTSLDPDSKSQKLARVALEAALQAGYSAELLDLRDFTLPFAGEENSFDDERVVRLKEKMSTFKKLVFCVPVYNYDVSASAKNLLELVGDKWLENTTIGFICTAGGQSSYMSVMSFANSFMLDFRAWVVPRFVYSVSSDWHNGELKNGKVKERIEGLLEGLMVGSN